MRQAPGFWWAETPIGPARLLKPFGAIYGALTARRMARPGLTLPVPVLCIGNFVAGGAGKTPTALACAALLQAEGHRPAFLSRGYGRHVDRSQRNRVLRVDPGRHDASAVGDEPLLLAAAAPTYVASDRRAAARQAAGEGATVLILDDGLQNPALMKTLAIAVVDGASGVGNGLCVPAGPLRAPLPIQWPFVHALCLVGDGVSGEKVATSAQACGLPILRAHLRPDPAVVAKLRGSRLLAFAGIGRPEKFFSTLESCGLEIQIRHSFPDHHPFSENDRKSLLAEASAVGALLITTTKDRARLPPDFPAVALPVTLEFDAPDIAARLLTSRLPLPRA